jgi:hypothetical protein
MKWLYIVFHKKFYFGLVRLDWIRLGFGLGWVGLGWVLGWVGLGWDWVLDWIRLGFGLSWVGLGWVGLGWH